jgi:hypothetical protein
MTPRVIIRKESAGRPTELVVFGDNGEIVAVDVTGQRGLRLVADIVNAHLMDECKRLGDGQ